MTFTAVIRNGAIELPAAHNLPDGTIVRIETLEPKVARDLLPVCGTWEGDDADRIVAEIYQLRSSSRRPVSFD